MIRMSFPPRSEWMQLARYYFAGILNMFFAYILFAVFLQMGVQVYVAQALGYVLGVMFNYLTYTRIAFLGMHGSKLPFVASYIGNYLLGLLFLWLALKAVPSPYIAGLLVTIALSLLNYLVLRKWVFRVPEQPQTGA